MFLKGVREMDTLMVGFRDIITGMGVLREEVSNWKIANLETPKMYHTLGIAT